MESRDGGAWADIVGSRSLGKHSSTLFRLFRHSRAFTWWLGRVLFHEHLRGENVDEGPYPIREPARYYFTGHLRRTCAMASYNDNFLFESSNVTLDLLHQTSRKGWIDKNCFYLRQLQSQSHEIRVCADTRVQNCLNSKCVLKKIWCFMSI